MFAAHQRWLAQPQQDGRTNAAHLKVAAKRDPRAAADLAGPRFPADCAYVWTWFCELSAARPASSSSMRTAGGFAATTTMVPISFAELDAWARLTGRRPEPWEVDLLRSLDAAWLAGGKRYGDGDGDRGHGPA